MKHFIYLLTFCSLIIFQSCLRGDETPISIPAFKGALLTPNVGGATEPNQVWIDLGSGQMTTNKRDSWDLAFHMGSTFKVMLNGSLLMAAARVEDIADIDQVNESTTRELIKRVQVANFDPTNTAYIDDPKGSVNGYTSIAEVDPEDSKNAVYLVNMGLNIATNEIPNGSVSVGSSPRGWMKIQITRSGNDYKIRYAELNSPTHSELIIPKNTAQQFVFFSLKDHNIVSVQPKNWDLCFTTFTGIIPGAGSFSYADFVVHNINSGVGVYQIKIPNDINSSEYFNNFQLKDVDPSQLISDDQQAIGASWRSTMNGAEVYFDRFYIIKNSKGLFFKLKFNRMSNLNGVRGFPELEYEPL